MKTFEWHSIVWSLESYASRIKILSSKFRIYVQITVSCNFGRNKDKMFPEEPSSTRLLKECCVPQQTRIQHSYTTQVKMEVE